MLRDARAIGAKAGLLGGEEILEHQKTPAGIERLTILAGFQHLQPGVVVFVQIILGDTNGPGHRGNLLRYIGRHVGEAQRLLTAQTQIIELPPRHRRNGFAVTVAAQVLLQYGTHRLLPWLLATAGRMAGPAAAAP